MYYEIIESESGWLSGLAHDLLAHVGFLINQNPQVFLLRTAVNPFSVQVYLYLKFPWPVCETLHFWC